MRKLAAAIGVLALMAVIIAPVFADDSDAATIKIEGYLYNETKKIGDALQIEVSAVSWDTVADNSTLLGKTTTLTAVKNGEGVYDGTYKFSISVNSGFEKSTTYLYISIGGFSVKNVNGKIAENATAIPVYDPVPDVAEQPKIQCYKFAETGAASADYEINTQSSLIYMKSASGTITGKVTNNSSEPVRLSGVKVTLYDLQTQTALISTTTNNGMYTITYSTGEYGLSYELDNYNKVDTKVRINDSQTETMQDVKLVEKNSWFGTDLPHILMVLGGVIGLILIVVVSIHRISISRK